MSFAVYMSCALPDLPRARRLRTRLTRVLTRAEGTSEKTDPVFLADPTQGFSPYVRGVLEDARYLVICLGTTREQLDAQSTELAHFLRKNAGKAACNVLFVDLRDLSAERGLIRARDMASRAGQAGRFDTLVISASQNSDDKIAHRLASPVLDQPFDALWNRKGRGRRATLWRLAKQVGGAAALVAAAIGFATVWNPLEIDSVDEARHTARTALAVNAFLTEFAVEELAQLEGILPRGAIVSSPQDYTSYYPPKGYGCMGIFGAWDAVPEQTEGTGTRLHFGNECTDEDRLATGIYPWAAPALRALVEACNDMAEPDQHLVVDDTEACTVFTFKDLVHDNRDVDTFEFCHVPQLTELARQLAYAGREPTLTAACEALQ